MQTRIHYKVLVCKQVLRFSSLKLEVVAINSERNKKKKNCIPLVGGCYSSYLNSLKNICIIPRRFRQCHDAFLLLVFFFLSFVYLTHLGRLHDRYSNGWKAGCGRLLFSKTFFL